MPVVVMQHIPFKDLHKRLPSRFHLLKKPVLPKDELVTVMVFPKSVIQSRTVRHTLKKIFPNTEKAIACGQDFTDESVEILRQVGVWIMALREHGWTDEMHDYIRAKY